MGCCGFYACSLALLVAGCASQAPRPAVSSLGCMQAAIAHLPETTDDTVLHCAASGLIARHCSAVEAVMAGTGKELRDLFTRGDASWSDLRSNRRGRQCARVATSDADVARCCASDST